MTDTESEIIAQIEG